MIHVALQQNTPRTPMYLIAIGWLYVAMMMAVAEATSTDGTVLGALFTFLLYGLAPVSLLVYIMATPGRKRAIRARELAEQRAHEAAAATPSTAGAAPAPSGDPDGSGQAPADAVAPVRKEP